LTNHFTLWLQRAWFHRSPWLLLLSPLEGVYRLLVVVRRALYAQGILASSRNTCPVVVVGNLTVGGTGKTPTVIALVEALARKGIRAGVVSRGYGARPVFPPGEDAYRLNEQSSVASCGDEMFMVFRRTRAPCAIARRRSAAVELLAASGEVDIVLSDDGLQHYALARDFEIVLFDAESAFGNGRCLPVGPLREPLSRLREADIVLARSQEPAPNSVALVPNCFVNVTTGSSLELNAPTLPREVIAVAGVGHPELFFRQLRSMGFEVQERRFPDHHKYSEPDLLCEADQVIIMTEKDAVKCSAIAPDNTWLLKVDAVVPETVVEQVERVAVLAQSARAPQSGHPNTMNTDRN